MNRTTPMKSTGNLTKIKLPIPPKPTPTLLELLKENHERWHIFFNDAGFHNHISHALIALHTLGASSSTLETSYQYSKTYQRPLFASPSEVSKENWLVGLGNPKYYSAYVSFFSSELESKGVQKVLEEYLFSEEANFPDTGIASSLAKLNLGDSATSNNATSRNAAQEPPQMLNRFLDALLHPFIHVGYALEFNLAHEDSENAAKANGVAVNGSRDVGIEKDSNIPPVVKIMIIEGLAQTAVHVPSSGMLIPADLFRSGNGITKNVKSPKQPIHALAILSRILTDPSFGGFKASDRMKTYDETIEKFGERVKEYVDMWIDEDFNNDQDKHSFVERKLEEVIWAVTLIYGVCGYDPKKEKAKFGFSADFFFAHFITSCYFLPFFVANFSPRSSILLLRTYLSSVLCWWIGRGRPEIEAEKLKTFFEDADLVQGESGTWSTILEWAGTHMDAHVPKLQRSLEYFDKLFGDVKAGYFKQGSVELAGSEFIDGSLFLRTAALSARRFGIPPNVADHVLVDTRIGIPDLEDSFVWDR